VRITIQIWDGLYRAIQQGEVIAEHSDRSEFHLMLLNRLGFEIDLEYPSEDEDAES